jgi:hypothetical protein
LDNGESGTFPKVRRKEKNKTKNMALGISEQRKETSMSFPRLPLWNLEAYALEVIKWFRRLFSILKK